MKRGIFVSIGLLAITALSLAQGQGGEGRQGFGGRQRFGQQQGMIGLLSRNDVRSELKISDDQSTKLAELGIRVRGQGGPGGGGQGGGRQGQGQGGGRQGQGGGRQGQGGQGGNFDPEVMRQAARERETKIMAILEPGQQKRLKELFVQRSGNRAAMNEAIQKDLGLSEDQVAKLRDLQQKQQEANRAVMQKVRDGSLSREDVQSTIQKNEEIMNTEIGKILTSAQAAKLKEMGGAPFKFEEDGL
jgi:hypothetical protein